MSYGDVSMLSADGDFLNRCTACVAAEGEADPQPWTIEHQWQLASAPGFGDRYASALINGIARPGWDQSVISDPDILGAVQAIRSAP